MPIGCIPGGPNPGGAIIPGTIPGITWGGIPGGGAIPPNYGG